MNISLAFATELISNYAKNHWTQYINQSPAFLKVMPRGAVDSRCVWFDLNDVQAFIAQAAGANCDGIRIYFGEYSADMLAPVIANLQAELQTNPANANDLQARITYLNQCTGLHTLVMIPTVPGDNNTHTDYDVNSGYSDFAQLATDMPDAVISALNHGHLIPPPWPPQSQGGQPGYDDGSMGNTLMEYADTP